MPVANAALSALLNLTALGGLPFLVYFAYQKWRRNRSFGEIARRAGLQLGDTRYIGYSLIAALATVAALTVWPPPLAPFLREGSPQRAFAGLGLGGQAVVMALLYGVVQTGFPEELLFRGLIAGSLARRLSGGWANLLQALIFLAPHLLVLLVMPEMWWVIPLVFGGALFAGWLRIRSGSIIGPWLIHASANVAVCLSVAARTDSPQ
ncbi:MAG TPA: type II CAAX endopeptidase family protein [Gemmataceae bacterium]|jgi:membrane protease YdiL (CAAX protease family)